jgi:hypothetical protein
MKKYLLKSVGVIFLLLAAGSALASAVFDVWGYGTTWQDARNDARSVGVQVCIGNGYAGADVEEVQTYESGGGYISYGIAQCY